jgi:hypothetical protein
MELQLHHPVMGPALADRRRRNVRPAEIRRGVPVRAPADRLVPVLTALLAAPFAMLTASARWTPALPDED